MLGFGPVVELSRQVPSHIPKICRVTLSAVLGVDEYVIYAAIGVECHATDLALIVSNRKDMYGFHNIMVNRDSSVDKVGCFIIHESYGVFHCSLDEFLITAHHITPLPEQVGHD